MRFLEVLEGIGESATGGACGVVPRGKTQFTVQPYTRFLLLWNVK